MSKVNKTKDRKLGFLKKNVNLMVVLFLLTGVFLISGCKEKSENVLFDSESDWMEADSMQNQEKPLQEREKDVTEEESQEDVGTTETDATSEICYVYVCGAVARPGVYEVEKDTRICEVINYAGGLTSEAEITCINQALAVYDGLMLNIPTVEQWKNGEFGLDENGFPVQVPKSEQKLAEGNDSSVDDGKVDINTATVEQLCTLPGVGTSRAESIITYREEHGAFENIEDIKKVTGIKDGLFEKIKDKIKV